jgi:hypothetical protein
MRSRVQLEIAIPGNSSWMPYTPQGVTGLDDDDDDDNIILQKVNYFTFCILYKKTDAMNIVNMHTQRVTRFALH